MLFLSACSFVDVQDYIHEPTHELRQSIIFSGQQEIDGIEDRKFVIVPNFRTFTSSYLANRAHLIIVSDNETSIRISNVILLNKDSGASESIELDQVYEVSKSVPETGYYLGFVPLLSEDYVGFKKFNQANEIVLTITYRMSGGVPITETMTLKLVTKKDVAWVT